MYRTITNAKNNVTWFPNNYGIGMPLMSVLTCSHPYESSDDLYGSSANGCVLNLRSRNASILKDSIGVKPDLEIETRCSILLSQIMSLPIYGNCHPQYHC